MRKLFLHMMLSLDGYIEGPNGELDWHRADEEYEKHVNHILRSVDGILIGRNVCEVFINYWPSVFEELNRSEKPSHHLETARLLHALPKYVVSTSLKNVGWNNTHLINENIPDEIRKLKEQPGNDNGLFGGAELANSLMNANLIDEYRLIINPIILGNGRNLWLLPLPMITGNGKPNCIDPLASNTQAHRFYKRLGFQFVEQRRFGKDDCFVYRLDRK